MKVNRKVTDNYLFIFFGICCGWYVEILLIRDAFGPPDKNCHEILWAEQAGGQSNWSEVWHFAIIRYP